MKKIFAIVLLIALALVPVFAKSEFFAVGLEAGYPAAGVTVNYDIDSKWDGYATASFDYRGAITVAVGGQYEVTKLEIESVKLPVMVGLQVVPTVAVKTGTFSLQALATGAVNYDFSIDDFDFTAYFRAGLGLGIVFGGTPKFAYGAALGCVYNF